MRIRTIFALLLCLTAPTVCSAADNRHVVLITIDGFPARMFWDPKTPIPRLRQLAAAGAAAEGMRVSNPTLTWPNHTTLVTGVPAAKHSVLYNGILQRAGTGLPVMVDPKREKAELVAVPTLFDELHKAGLRTAAINWPCTRNSGSIDDDFPDVPDTLLHTTVRLRRELVAQGILPDDKDVTFRAMTGPERDEVWTKAACHVIRTRRPNFLLFHLLNSDGTHHRYGAETPASYTALALADVHVGRVLDALDGAGILMNTTVFVVSDHGFATATNVLQPNVLFRQAGLIELGATNRMTKAQAQVVSIGGSGMIYLTNPQTRDADRKKVMELLRGKEGVADLIEPDRFAELGLPLPEKNGGMGDLVLVPRDGYAVSAAATGNEFVLPISGTMNVGYHGYLASNPRMNALFIAAGDGIKKGIKIGLVDNMDVAPTIAHVLGRPLLGANGKVLSQILIKPGP
ncbi:MAG TPA: alkaline phosphatase family protein [Verrucomicrobiae bacterium]|nr:alkaline phosphatase family protein [Verrucomicrobiae bacterium]